MRLTLPCRLVPNAEEESAAWEIRDALGKQVGVIFDPGEGDAIVRATNAHARMLDALRLVYERLRDGILVRRCDPTDLDSVAALADDIATIERAIAAGEGRP